MSQSDEIKQRDNLIIHLIFVIALIYTMARFHFSRSTICFCVGGVIGHWLYQQWQWKYLQGFVKVDIFTSCHLN